MNKTLKMNYLLFFGFLSLFHHGYAETFEDFAVNGLKIVSLKKIF